MSQINELLPCPFCGCEKPSLWPSGGYWKIKCVDGCAFATNGYMSKSGAVVAWNRRPNKELFASKLADLEAENKRLTLALADANEFLRSIQQGDPIDLDALRKQLKADWEALHGETGELHRTV